LLSMGRRIIILTSLARRGSTVREGEVEFRYLFAIISKSVDGSLFVTSSCPSLVTRGECPFPSLSYRGEAFSEELTHSRC